MRRTVCLILSFIMVVIMIVPYNAFAKDIYQNNDVSHAVVHDPSVVKSEDGKYYIVGSHLAMAKSDNLIDWENTGFSLDGENYLSAGGNSWKDTLKEPLEWCLKYQKAVPEKYSEGSYEYNCWANDIIYNKAMGKYCLYGCCSVWGTTASAIWLCTADNIEGPYTYVDTMIYSGITSQKRNNSADPVIVALDWQYTNIPELINQDIMSANKIDNSKWPGAYNWVTWDGYYNCWGGQFPNCIDPTAFVDSNGDMWLVYGSYSGGCYLHKLDRNTGLVDRNYAYNNTSKGYDVYYGKQLSKTNAGTEGTGEGPYIIYDNASKYYYFFLTYGGLAGDGGYNIREYRSKSPEGPYTDAAGYSALDEKNTGLKLAGNYKFSCQPGAYVSGGHSSCLIDSDGSMYQAYHTRFTADNGWGHQTRIHKMLRTSDGWAVMTPFEYRGEKDTSSVAMADIIGEYEFIDSNNMYQRKETAESPWSDIVLPTQTISLNQDGTITGAKDFSCSQTNVNTGSRAVSGTWSLKANTAYCTVKLGSVTYNCAFAIQKDESESAKSVMTFSGAGSDNSSVWGVMSKKYSVVNPPAPAKKITVKATKFTSLKGGKKAFTAKWKKISGVTGYQLQYSLKSNFKGAKTVNVKNAKTIKKTVKSLKKKKKYYVRIRAYKKSGSKNYYSGWTKKTVKTK